MSTEQLAQALRDIAEHRMSMYGNDDFFHLMKIARTALAVYELEKAQAAAPFGWMIEGSECVWRGEFAESDAKGAARIVGGTCRAFPIYRDAPAAPVAVPLPDELTGKLMRIHAALGKMGKKYGEIGSRDVDVARWNADLYEAIAAVGGVLADQPLEQLARIKLEGGQG